MTKYNIRSQYRRWPMLLVVFVAGLILLAAIAMIAIRHVYHENLKPVSNVQTVHLVTVPTGASANQIASILKKEGLIRSDWAFKWYVSSKEVREKLQAGTYALRPSQGVAEIVSILYQGKVATNKVTILPGKRIDQIRQAFINAGFSQPDVDHALNPELYKDHPALVDKPASANLEGYLYPETFQKDSTTKPEDIVRQSLDQMQKRLTPDLRAAFASHGLSVYQAITLASIVEQEVSKPQDRAQAAQVFLLRLHQNMPFGSDVTAFYGAILADQPPSVSYDSPYNTRLHSGWPPGPISNVSEGSLQAVAHPADTDWLYFVAGDDGNTYFSHTIEEHQALINEHCKKLCSSTE